MILGIHQPQYLPWLPYYSKISQSNIFVFLDNVQFQKNGLHNRNEVINSNGRFWLTVPVDAKLGDSLSEVNIINNGWEKKHTKSLRMNYSKAKNFEFYEKYIEPQILKKYKRLIDLNIALIRTISENFFGLKVEFIKQSEIECNEKE